MLLPLSFDLTLPLPLSLPLPSPLSLMLSLALLLPLPALPSLVTSIACGFFLMRLVATPPPDTTSKSRVICQHFNSSLNSSLSSLSNCSNYSLTVIGLYFSSPMKSNKFSLFIYLFPPHIDLRYNMTPLALYIMSYFH